MSAVASHFTEVKTGGRYARRNVVLGEMVGESEVVERLGFGLERSRGILWSVKCVCGELQIRSSGQINAALRKGHSLSCPPCVKEYLRGSGAYLRDQRSLARLERVLDGGPVWSAYEIADLQAEVLSDLEAEFGPTVERTLTIAEMQSAVGWKSNDTRTLEEKEAEKIRIADNYAYTRASEALDRAAKTANAVELEDCRRRARELVLRIRNDEFRQAQIEILTERWDQIIKGLDIVNPDKVTKKKISERLAQKNEERERRVAERQEMRNREIPLINKMWGSK